MNDQKWLADVADNSRLGASHISIFVPLSVIRTLLGGWVDFNDTNKNSKQTSISKRIVSNLFSFFGNIYKENKKTTKEMENKRKNFA